MKHTRSPWVHLAKLSGSENHKGYRIASEARSWWIADVSPIDQDGKEGEANARLIAAAPELLAALEGLLAITNSLAPEAHVARIAIAKTRGEPEWP